MTNTFAWLDYSAQERKSMLEIVDLFREKGTVDELGLGVIRDAFADRFFPGTSTLQSRARYWLFVPWIYRQLEAERTPSAKADERARQLQAGLVRALEAGGESQGVIGIEARDKVLRPPAALYWAGLERYGIRLVRGSIGRYHASLDRYYVAMGVRRSEGDETEVVDSGPRNWHPGLPAAPSDFRDRAAFKLSWVEADYLRERFVTGAPDSFLAWSLTRLTRVDKVEYLWDHPQLDTAPSELRQVVEMARRFSLLMYGAVVVYNLAIAERAQEEGIGDGSRVGQYRDLYAAWVRVRAAPDLEALQGWDQRDLWLTIERLAPGRVQRTKAFAEAWIRRVLESPADAADDPLVRSSIATRERQLKGSLARLYDRRALERWSGQSGVGQLSYRWNEGSTLLRDIGEGLRLQSTGDE
jgi:hypothetical protein